MAKAKAGPKRKIGRPRIVIDWTMVDNMCAVHCTGEEQAGILGYDYDTLNNACKREKKCSFSEYFRQKSANGKMSLRRQQYSTAISGNATMLIWLGKAWLGQTDQKAADPQGGEAEPLTIQFNVKPAVGEIQITNVKP